MKYYATLRYGSLRNTGRFVAGFSGLHMGDLCIIRSERGVEAGEIVTTVKPVPEDCKENFDGEIMRQASPQDRERWRRIQDEDEPREFKFCQEKIRERGLPMKLASVEHLLGDNKIIFYFLADGRVDFRALVKDLAQEYHARIEMRQIGVRDEARLLGYFEHCGRELCCKTFIKQLEPVTMKMAKNQKATLDPTKISGRCGRLMCCLRFEDAIYEELRRRLPRRGARVETPKGPGVVTQTEPLAQTVSVDVGGAEMIFPLKQIKVIAAPERSSAEETLVEGVDSESAENESAEPTSPATETLVEGVDMGSVENKSAETTSSPVETLAGGVDVKPVENAKPASSAAETPLPPREDAARKERNG